MLFLHKQLYDAVKLFDLLIIAFSTLYLQKLHFVFTSSLCVITNLYLVCCIFCAKFECTLNLLLLICFHGNIDLLVANEWFLKWCSLRQNVDMESAFAIRMMQIVFEVFLGAGLKVYKYESRVFTSSRISCFAF